MCGLNERSAGRWGAAGIALFLVVIFAACESSISLDLPEVKTLQKDILEQFSNIDCVAMNYGEKSKDVCLSVYGENISEAEAFSIVRMARDMAVQRGFQDGLAEAIGGPCLTPVIQLAVHDAGFTIPAYPNAPPDAVTHCRYSFSSCFYFSPVHGDFSDLSQVRFVGYSEWNGTENISEFESRDIFWDEIQAKACGPLF